MKSKPRGRDVIDGTTSCQGECKKGRESEGQAMSFHWRYDEDWKGRRQSSRQIDSRHARVEDCVFDCTERKSAERRYESW